jgi:hypothetical protein
MIAVPITLKPELKIRPGVKLFDWEAPPPVRTGRLYDVAPDGRFLVVTRVATSAPQPAQVTLILNWVERARRLLDR